MLDSRKLGEKDLKASALKVRREEQKQADQQATISWLQRESKRYLLNLA